MSTFFNLGFVVLDNDNGYGKPKFTASKNEFPKLTPLPQDINYLKTRVLVPTSYKGSLYVSSFGSIVKDE